MKGKMVGRTKERIYRIGACFVSLSKRKEGWFEG